MALIGICKLDFRLNYKKGSTSHDLKDDNSGQGQSPYLSYAQFYRYLGALCDREASYKYFQHGPLTRTQLGHYRVQGMDYTYTLQGWIKGLNASFINPFRDMGQDAQNTVGNPNRYTAADAFTYTLGFYNDVNSLGSTKIKDYYPIGGGIAQMEVNYTDTGSDTAPFHTDAKSQFTGNIRFIAKQTRDMTPNGASIQTYRYDQLMRLNAMNTYFPGASALSSWLVRATGFTAPLQSIYKEADITYDRNGNILTYQRWGNNASVQDSLNYKYIAGTNKLSRVADQVSAGTYAGDVDGQSAGNYTYDGAGNLSTDAQGGASITWSPYGKVLEVYRAALTSTTLFGYDATQNRVKKQQTSLSSNISTFYIRDAQGNVLAVYEKDGSSITWKEQHLYGSSRLGSIEPGVAWTAAPDTVPYFRSSRALKYGWKRYEVTDHLGNVRALISDRKTYNGTVFMPAILNATDYFPFGSEMRGSVTAGNQKYRYGFNGKELDKNGEFGSLNHYDYGFRIYNPGIGRFLSVDPLTKKYPELTPYQFASNTPIQAVDLDGLEMYYAANGNYLGKNGSSTEIRIIGRDDIAEKAKNNLVHSNWDHKWLEGYSTKAYENTKANQHTVLSNWARQHRTRDVERAMSLYTLKINSPDGKGQTEVFVEGTTVVAPRSSSRGGGGLVDPSGSITNLPDAKRSTTIHTHPYGDALEFSNEAPGPFSGGDLQYAVSYEVDLYLVPPTGNEMGKFSINQYEKVVRSRLARLYPNDDSYKKMPNSELFHSYEGEPHNNTRLVEYAKHRVKIEEPK